MVFLSTPSKNFLANLFFAELYDHKLSRLLFDLFPISDDVMGRHLGFPSMAFRITPSKTFLANQNALFYPVTNLLANQNALFFFRPIRSRIPDRPI